MEKLRHFSLFSGIESFKKAMTNLGIENELVGYSEFDKYASVALSAIHGVSEELNYGDITKIDETKVPDCDLITYGFPCQDISIAGNQKGIVEGETRSGLLYDALRIIKHKMPKYAIAENVKNLVGKKFKDDFNSLLEELDRYGYNNYWQVLNAKDYGIPQNRERVFIVSIRKDVDNGKFEFPKPFDSGLRLKDLLEDEVEDKYYIDNERVDKLLSQINKYGNKMDEPQKPHQGNYALSSREGRVTKWSDVMPALCARDYKDPKVVTEPKRLGGLYDNNGKKRQAGAVWDKESISPTIDTCQGGHREPLIVASRGRNPNNPSDRTVRVYDEEGISPTIPTCGGGNIEPKVAVREATKKGYAVATVGDSINLEQPNSKTRRGRVGKEVAQTLTTSCNQATLVSRCKVSELKTYPRQNIYQNTFGTLGTNCGSATSAGGGSVIDTNYKIRKLTPKECWRLMGFADEDYHKARQALEDRFYNGKDRSNSQMYKMAGNSIVVDVLEGILKNLIK